MRTIILFSLLIFIGYLSAPSCFGQSQNETTASPTVRCPIGAGSKIVSGMGSLSVTTVEGSDNSIMSLTLAPSIINFVVKGFGIGGDCSLTLKTVGGLSASAVMIGPKIMAAFGQPDGTVFPYIGLGVNYITGSSGNSTASGSAIKIGFGLLTKAGDNLGIPVEFGIVMMNVEDEKGTVYSLGFGFSGIFY